MSVYFVQMGMGGPVKIGTARNVKKRLEAISVPEPLHILAVIDGDRTLERALHLALAAFRKRGEWFNPAPEVLAVCSVAKHKGAEAVGRWLTRVGAQPYPVPAPATSDNLDHDIIALTAHGVREVLRIHGLDAAKKATGKKFDTIQQAALGRLDMRFTDLLALVRLEPSAFAPLFARINCSLIEAGEAIDAYRGKAA